MNYYKRVLTIAGSDSGGGAGIQADIKTISALGCYGASVITAVTAQNTISVGGVRVMDADFVDLQCRMVLDDIGADVIKIGMLGSGEVASVVADVLDAYPDIPVVLDPVLVATSGDSLSGGSVVDVIVNRLIRRACVVTPNLPEAFALTGVSFDFSSSYDQLRQAYDGAWAEFEKLGAQAVLLKGGHGQVEGSVVDMLYESGRRSEFKSEFLQTHNTHGTGCTLASAVASYLALGYDLKVAVDNATAYVHHAIATAAEYRIGHGHGPVHHFYKIWQ